MQPLRKLAWSLMVASLRAAHEDPVLAQRYAECCSCFTGFPLQAEPTEKARVPRLGISRGHALLKQAVEWNQHCIGGKKQPNQLDGVRGSLWRYVIAFSGWEQAGRAVLWDGTQQSWFQQRFLAILFDASTNLTPPWPDREQVPANLKQWLTFSLDESHPFPDLLALGDGEVDFVPWLLGKPHRLQPWAVFSCLRNVVAHGALSPTKAQHWGLVQKFNNGVGVLHNLFLRLAVCSGTWMEIDG